MIEDNFSALIGVVGTLLGVVLGALLNRIARLGKIKVFVNEVDYSFLKRNSSGGFKSMNSITNETEKLAIRVKLDIFNSSEYSRKIMRGIKFRPFENGKELVIKMYNNEVNDITNFATQTGKLRVLNLNPKEIKSFILSVSLDKDIERIYNSKWFLTYKNTSNKEVKIKLDKSK
ncbi:hypothetical protein OOZ15_13985 [Galbibacter sp. EGI 63066]|uniref:hypothetical protein n=1 Tax=Galbibacter sp. EGI 63066 TaxID=2993559 RepID=UPI0022495844|nr:hypothetical protein [Galbibacter sp. EGI 63066]MCX2681058.1 hypothetical protein [Galbibacter sp. EGI 63066]